MLEILISYIQPTIAAYGALGVFLATLLEEVVAPIPSPLVPLTAGFFLLPADGSYLEIAWRALFLISLPVASGVTLGSSAVYGLGYWGGKPAIEKNKKWLGISWASIERTEARLTRGSGDEIALFILRLLPIVPGVAISGFCGIVRYPFKTFAVITFFGAMIRAFMLGVVGWSVGSAYQKYSEAITAVEKTGLAILIAAAALFLIVFFLKRRRGKNQLEI
jgi:membrane protein DedA with SNARE-associated domain